MLRCFVEDAIRWIEVDVMVRAGALTLSKGEISATLMPDGMSLALQQGVYFSWFGNTCLRQSMGMRFDGNYSHVTTHHAIWDEFKIQEGQAEQDPRWSCLFYRCPTHQAPIQVCWAGPAIGGQVQPNGHSSRHQQCEFKWHFFHRMTHPIHCHLHFQGQDT